MGAKKRLKLGETVSDRDESTLSHLFSPSCPQTKHACICGTHESTRQRLESSPPKDHEDNEDHIAEKGYYSMSHYIWGTKTCSDTQARKVLDAKSRSGQGTEEGRNDPAWQLDRVKGKEEIILEAQWDNEKVHFATLMDICHLKNADIEPKFQKRQGRVALRGDTSEDDSEVYAVSTEQGSSSSQKTAVKVMDVIARLPDCAGQEADSTSAYIQG